MVTEAFDVIVLGAGPSGLAAAVALKQRGIDRVVVLDREMAAGGATRHCGHPPFGLREFGRVLTGPSYAKRLAGWAARHGVDLRLRHSAVALEAGGRLTVATPDGVRTLQGRRVILAMGARETTRAARLLTGDRPIGVMNTGAFQSHIALQNRIPFRRPVIVGTELVALSAIWTCLSHGIRPQRIVDERSELVTRWPLGLASRLAGIPLRLGATILDIRGAPRVEAITVGSSAGPAETIACDGLLLTGQFLPETGVLATSPIALDPGSNGPVVDQMARCSDPAYFACGNLLRPVETAAWCFREGGALGATVADDLAGRLPAAKAWVTIARGRGVKLTVPQCIGLPSRVDALGRLQVRFTEARSGTLVLRRNGDAIWRKPMQARPERRVLVPLDGLGPCAPGDAVEIAFEEDHA